MNVPENEGKDRIYLSSIMLDHECRRIYIYNSEYHAGLIDYKTIVAHFLNSFETQFKKETLLFEHVSFRQNVYCCLFALVVCLRASACIAYCLLLRKPCQPIRSQMKSMFIIH